MSDISNIYLQARQRANAVNSTEWDSIKRTGNDPGQILFDEPVYNNIEKRIVGTQQQWVGAGDDDKPDGEEAGLFSEEAPPDIQIEKKPEPLFEGEPSISNRSPLTMREKFQFGTQDALMSIFEMPANEAVELSKKLFGGTPEDQSAPGFGLGLADLMGLGEIFAIEEGLDQADRGLITGDKGDVAMGAGMAALGSIAPIVVAKKIISSPQARKVLQEAKDRWSAGQPVMTDAIIKAGGKTDGN